MKKWFVLYAQFNHEKKVHAELLKNGIESYLPILKTLKQWSDRKKKIELVMFPCYNFVFCNESELYSILNYKGIVTVVKFGDKLATISDKEMTLIKQVELHPDEVSILHGNYEKGEKVKIQSGVFSGLIGEILRLKDGDEKQFVLLLELFGTKVVTTINALRIMAE